MAGAWSPRRSCAQPPLARCSGVRRRRKCCCRGGGRSDEEPAPRLPRATTRQALTLARGVDGGALAVCRGVAVHGAASGRGLWWRMVSSPPAPQGPRGRQHAQTCTPQLAVHVACSHRIHVLASGIPRRVRCPPPRRRASQRTHAAQRIRGIRGATPPGAAAGPRRAYRTKAFGSRRYANGSTCMCGAGDDAPARASLCKHRRRRRTPSWRTFSLTADSRSGQARQRERTRSGASAHRNHAYVRLTPC
jgi:hypothetical protein